MAERRESPMLWTAIVLLSIPLALIAINAYAEPLTVNWTIADTREDGSPYPPGERGGTKIYYKAVGSSTKRIRNVRSPTATTVTIDVPPGSYTVTATHYDTGGRESKPSAAATKIVAPKPPALPGSPRNVR